MSMCGIIIISCAVGRESLLWSVHSLGKTVSLCPASFCTPRPNLPVIPCMSWLLTFIFQSAIWKGYLFLVLVLEDLGGLLRMVWLFSFFGFSGWGIDLDCCDVEWFALEMNWDHFVAFEIAPKYCISDSFVDHEGYFISSIMDSCH